MRKTLTENIVLVAQVKQNTGRGYWYKVFGEEIKHPLQKSHYLTDPCRMAEINIFWTKGIPL